MADETQTTEQATPQAEPSVTPALERKEPDTSLLLAKPPEEAEAPEPEAEEEAATEPEAETEEGAGKPDDDDEGETPEASEESEPADEGDSKKPHNRDKAVQKLQQNQSAFERQVGSRFESLEAKISESIDKLMERVGGAQEQAKPKQQAADKTAVDDAQRDVDDAEDELAKLLEGSDDDDELVGSKDFRLLAKTMRDQINKLKATITEREKAQQAEAQQAQQAQSFRQKFEADHPELAGRYEELVDEAADIVERDYGDLSENVKAGASVVVWKQVVDQAKQASGEPAKADAKTKPKRPEPARTKPDKSPAGTSVVKTSATRTGMSHEDRLDAVRSTLVARR